jgi:hypothetical protein
MLDVTQFIGFGAVGQRPIEFIGSVLGSNLSNNDTSVTSTIHQVGDLLIASVYSANTDVEPTVTAGWTKIHTFYSPSLSQRLGVHYYKFATNASETIEATNAGTISGSSPASAIIVFRNARAIGATTTKTNYSGSSVNSIAVPTLTLQDTSGRSAVVLSTYIFTGDNISACTGCSISNGWAYEMNATSFASRTATVENIQSILGVIEVLN